jgi:hypothetical protein
LDVSRPVRVRIGALVLHGFDPRDRHTIAAAVQQEVAAALRGSRFTSAQYDRVDAGTVHVHPRRPRGIGTRVARALKGALR